MRKFIPIILFCLLNVVIRTRSEKQFIVFQRAETKFIAEKEETQCRVSLKISLDDVTVSCQFDTNSLNLEKSCEMWKCNFEPTCESYGLRGLDYGSLKKLFARVPNPITQGILSAYWGNDELVGNTASFQTIVNSNLLKCNQVSSPVYFSVVSTRSVNFLGLGREKSNIYCQRLAKFIQLLNPTSKSN